MVFERRDFFRINFHVFQYNNKRWWTLVINLHFIIEKRREITTAVTNLMVDGCPYNCIPCTMYNYFGGGITRASDTHFALIKFHIYFSLYFWRQYSLLTSNPGRVSIFVITIIIVLHWNNRMQRYFFRNIFFLSLNLKYIPFIEVNKTDEQ